MSTSRDLTPEERRLWRQAMGHEPKPKEEKPATPVAEKKPPTKKALPPLAVQEGKRAARTLKPQGRVQATLDLHGIGKLEAYSRVQEFLLAAHAKGKRHVAIITGKGRTSEGVLRTNLPHWLNEPVLRRVVGSITHATPDKGGSGVFHVLLKK